MSRLQRTGYDVTKLYKLAHEAKSPKVRDEAQGMLNVIESEKNHFEAIKTDIDGLTDFLSKPCEACLVKGAAEAQLKKLKEAQTAKQIEQDERNALQSAGFVDVTVLRQLASGAKSREVRGQAQHRLDVIATEKKSYEAVKTDIDGLTDFLSKPCEACLVKGAAEAQLKKLEEAQTAKQIEQDERNALQSAGFVDGTVLRQLASGAKSREVRGQAQHRLDLIKKDWEKLNDAGNDETKLRTLAQDAETPDVKAEILRKLEEIAKRKEIAAREVQDENNRLVKAKFDETKLKSLAQDAKMPAVQEQIKRRLGVITKERTSYEYEAVKNDITGLTEFIKKPCEACLVRRTAETQLKKLTATPVRLGAISVSQPIGYVMFAVIDKENKLRKKFFDIDGKPNARFPAPNDKVTATPPDLESVTLRAIPYHWDINSGKSVEGKKELHEIKRGEKAEIAGNVFIATEEDPNSRQQYAIAPISKLIDVDPPDSKSAFVPQLSSQKILGYVYVGSIDANKNKNSYTDKRFKNEMRPFAIYPAPNDILVAMRPASVRAGPGRLAKQITKNGKTVEVKERQRVTVGGDTILTEGGLSIWAPISAIEPP